MKEKPINQLVGILFAIYHEVWLCFTETQFACLAGNVLGKIKKSEEVAVKKGWDRRVCGIIGILFFSVIAFFMGAGGSCFAADPPNGSYKMTCNTINYNQEIDKITSARCKKMDGKWNTTSLKQAQTCVNDGGSIDNCDGTLQCSGVDIPTAGSYRASCFCCKMSGIPATTLSCYCKNKKGKANYTLLRNATTCSSPWNDNGTLKCD